MNILVIPNRGRSYNAVRPEAECYIKMAELGHKVTVITCRANAYFENYQKSNVELIELVNTKKYSLSVIKQIRRQIKLKKIDIVYATESSGIPNAAFACIGTKAKMVAYRGTTGGMYKTDPTNYLCMLHPRINGVVCVSNAVSHSVKSKVRAKLRNNVVTIYKGHDIDWYQEPAVDLASLGTTKDNFNVLCIGSTRPHKGTLVAIDAMAELASHHNIKLVLVGDNIDKEPFTSQISQHGIADNIILTGFRNDVPALAKACDVLILPSLDKEGLSRTIMESLSNGTPAIASDIDTTKEVIEHQVNGLIYKAGDAKALAENIKLLVQDAEQLKALSAAAQATISGKMAHQKTVGQMLAFFNKLTT